MNARRTSVGLRAVAASAALGAALLLAGQGFAADTTSTQPTPATQAAPATAPGTQPAQAAPKRKMSHEDRVEARLKQLHDQLQITAAQQAQWDAYAGVMRDNAADLDRNTRQMDELIKARAEKRTMNAVDDLKAYEAVVDAHAARTQQYADGLKKLVPAFEALYASMSDSQKKIADAMFNRARRTHEPKEQKG